MSRARIVMAGLIAAALVVLLGWQLHRERLVKACLSTGGAWDGGAAARRACAATCSGREGAGRRTCQVSGSGSATGCRCRWL